MILHMCITWLIEENLLEVNVFPLHTKKKKKNESQNQLRRMFENHKITVLTRSTESFPQQT